MATGRVIAENVLMAPATSAWRRNLVGCVAVVAGVLALSLGVPAIDDALPNTTVSTTTPLEFADNASVVPINRPRSGFTRALACP